MENAEARFGSQGAQAEGLEIVVELIEKLKGKQGIHGLHIMPVGWEDIVPRIVTEAGLIGNQIQS